MAKKWTKAEREAASIAGKKRWAARKLRDTRQFDVVAPTVSYGGTKPMLSGRAAPKEEMATDIVSLIAGIAEPATIVKVVERILRP